MKLGAWSGALGERAPRGPQIVTEPIEVTLITGTTVDIEHDIGRPLVGWLVVWADAPVVVYVDDPALPTNQVLTLRSDTSATAKVVLLA